MPASPVGTHCLVERAMVAGLPGQASALSRHLSSNTFVMNGLRYHAFLLRCQKVGTKHAVTFGMRGPSQVTTVNSASTPLLQTGKTDRGFLAILAEASANESYGNSTAGLGQGVATGANTAKGGTGTQHGEQLPVLEVTPANREAGASATGTLPPADHDKVPANGTSNAQQDNLAPNRRVSESPATTEVPLNAKPSTVAPEIQAQLVAAQWTRSASTPEPPATLRTHTATEMPLNAKPWAVVSNIKAPLVAAQWTRSASAAEPPATQQAHAANPMPFNAEPSAVVSHTQAPLVAAQWTPNAPATEPPATQQAHAANEMPLNARPSAVVSDIQPQLIAAQATQGAPGAELPANQQGTANKVPLNSDSSTVAADIQAQFAAAQWTRNASAAELAANQQARMALGAVLDGAVAKGPRAEVTSNGTQVVDGPTTAVGEMLQASVEASLRVAFPDNAAVGAIGATGRIQPAKAAELKEAPGTTAPKNPSLTNAADADINKTGSTAVGVHNGSSGGQNSDQSPQNMNGSPDQIESAAARVAASSLPQAQVQTIATSGASHEIASSVSMPNGLADRSRSAGQVETPGINQQDIGEGVVTTAINSAKLIQTMGQTEMRVGLHTSDFGDISIRTSVSQQQMQAQISVDHSELSQAIAAHISSVQTKLGDEHGIQASIQIDNQGSSHSSNSEQSSQKQQDAFAGSARSADAADLTEADKGINLGMLVAASGNHRLDIRA
jgi:hypothetical protein